MTAGSFAERVEEYLRRILHDPRLAVDGVARIAGGASRMTWSVDVSWPEGADRRHDGLILRMDPEAGVLESNRRVEYELYRSLRDVPGVPVPEVLHIEDDPEPLGATFFVMRRVPGTSSAQEWQTPELAARRAKLAASSMEILAAVARIEPSRLPDLLDRPPDTAAAWRAELDRWERVARRDELEPQLVTRAAVRWLRRNPPPPADRLVLVHGDFRGGNFMYDGDTVTAYLDWEMAHLGDPLEDLAWFTSRPWRTGGAADGDVSWLVPRAECVRLFEQATGVTVDPAALRWWELFSLVKLQAIFLTSGQQFASGRTQDVLLAMIPLVYLHRMEAWMLEELEELGW